MPENTYIYTFGTLQSKGHNEKVHVTAQMISHRNRTLSGCFSLFDTWIGFPSGIFAFPTNCSTNYSHSSFGHVVWDSHTTPTT
jgi:hypothetical protein